MTERERAIATTVRMTISRRETVTFFLMWNMPSRNVTTAMSIGTLFTSGIRNDAISAELITTIDDIHIGFVVIITAIRDKLHDFTLLALDRDDSLTTS